MKKPNLALHLMASAVAAKRKALTAKTERVAQIYSRQADRYLRAAARAEDTVKALRIIKASNKRAVKASRMRADFDDVCVADEDDIIVNDIDDLDPIYSDDEFYGDEDIYAASDDEDKDDDDKDEDKDDEDKDEDKEVDSAMLRVLSRNRNRRLAAKRGRRF